MKKSIAVLLAVYMLMGLTVTAYATEPDINELTQDEPQEQITVSTLEDLQAAVTAAEDGNTIYISSMIVISNTAVETDKEITLTRANVYDSSAFICLSDGGKLSGFKLTESKNVAVEVYFTPEKAAIIDNCFFIGESENNSALINIWGGNASVEITNCSFDNNGYSAIISKANTIAEISNCTFSENSTQGQGGAISNGGTMMLSDCSFAGNTASSGGGIFSSGEMTISDCSFNGNTTINSKFGADIFSTGKLSITDDPQDSEGYFEEVTGEKATLPMTENTNTAKLIYLTDEQAMEYFKPEPVPEPEPEEPDEPQSPQPPYNPPDSSDDDDDDYTPPVIHKPTGGTTTPVTPTPAPVKPTLTCGDAVIDTSRSVVLQGYGDGLLHEDDPLTRAQMAAIIYRLLDDESVARYSSGESIFVDVPPDAWFAPFVHTINCAGVVRGVSPDKYAPDEFVTWAQIITVLTRFVEPQKYELQHIKYDGWAAQAVQTAVSLGWIEDSTAFTPDAVISRGQLVQLVNHVLEQCR